MSGETATSYHRPESIPAVHRRLDGTDGETAVIAGGQTLSLLLGRGVLDPDALVDVSGVSALSGVSVGSERTEIGAATTYGDIADHEVSDRAAALGDACGVIADRQIRNQGTVGGAVCHADPTLDILAVLRSLDATLRIGSVAGRRTVSLGAFLIGRTRTGLGESELLETISVAVPGDRTGTAYEKHSTIEAGWATVGAAAWVTVESASITDARVALTSVANTTVRAPSVEAELLGRRPTQAVISEASETITDDVDPVSDRSGSAAYKRRLAPTIVERSLERACRRAGGPE